MYENVKVNVDVMQYNYIHQNLLVAADQTGSREKMNSLDYWTENPGAQTKHSRISFLLGSAISSVLSFYFQAAAPKDEWNGY